MLRHLTVTGCALVAGLLAAAGGAGVGAPGASSASGDALVVLASADLAAFHEAIAVVQAAGGEVPQAYPPDAFVAELTPAAESALRRAADVHRIDRGAAPEAALAAHSANAGRAARVWNDVFRGAARTAPPGTGSSMRGEAARIRPARSGSLSASSAPPAAAGPAPLQTSEFMAGSIAYSVIFVESNGGTGNCAPADAQTENWDDARRAAVLSEISAGMAFWTARVNRPSPLTFVFDDLGVRTTSCEPIQGTSSADWKWITDIIGAMGYPADAGSYLDATHQLAHDRRTALGTDWAFVIFVVDSLNDADGYFSDGYFAYAHLNGPFVVMTYDNDNWGIDGMNYVTAHETGHIFGALDEYPTSNCSTDDTSGYLNVANASCNNGGIQTDYSIMGTAAEQVFPSSDVSTSAREAIGWRNPSGGLVDVVRTSTASISPYAPDPTNDDTPTYSGSGGNTPFPPGGCNLYDGLCWRQPVPVTVSKVASAQWNVNGGAFSSAGVVPADGAFNEESDAFTFTPPPVAPGMKTFGVRATNNFGHVSATQTDVLTIDVAPCGTVDTDGDGTCDAYDLDDDNDGCSDTQEAGADPTLGGVRDPLSRWDFYDVTGDKFIDLADTLIILQHFGHGPSQDATDNSLDRYVPNPSMPWRTAEASNGVDLVDALANLRSFGHSCEAAP